MSSIQLTPPDALPFVEQKDIKGTVPIKAEAVTSLNEQVEAFLQHFTKQTVITCRAVIKARINRFRTNGWDRNIRGLVAR